MNGNGEKGPRATHADGVDPGFDVLPPRVGASPCQARGRASHRERGHRPDEVNHDNSLPERPMKNKAGTACFPSRRGLISPVEWASEPITDKESRT